MILDRLFRPERKKTLTSADLHDMLKRGPQSAAGVNVTVDRAMNYATVFGCIRVLAESVGQLPVHLHQQRGREKRKATEHPLYSLLHDAPNEHQTAQEWKEWLVACLGLWGNAYCQIVRLGSKVLELVPLQPSSVTVKKHASGALAYEIAVSGEQKVTLPASEVLHVKLFSLDGVMGVSPLRYARESIGLAIGAEEYGASLFRNGANPGGVIEFPNVMSDEEYERVKESWESRHQGSQNSNKIAILEAGAKWHQIGLPAKDAQFLETRKFQRADICGFYRVPLHMVGDLERATFSNIEHQGLEFVVHTLMPYVSRIEQRVALQLLTPKERREYFAKFQMAGLLRGDMQARAAYYTSQVNIGAMSPNEVRELEDQNPREGGDVFLTPLNMAPNDNPAGGSPSPDPSPEAKPPVK